MTNDTAPKKPKKDHFEPYFTVRDVTEAEKRNRQRSIEASHQSQVQALRESMGRPRR